MERWIYDELLIIRPVNPFISSNFQRLKTPISESDRPHSYPTHRLCDANPSFLSDKPWCPWSPLIAPSVLSLPSSLHTKASSSPQHLILDLSSHRYPSLPYINSRLKLKLSSSATMARLLSNTVLKNLIRSSHSSKQMVMSTSAFRQYMRYSTRLSDDSGGHGDFHVDNSSASSTSYPTSISADSDTHEDFQPTTKSSGITWQDAVDQDVKENPVLIYMKGLPDDPKCGFSALAVKVLQQYNVPISARDILGDPKLKESVKAYSNWPTFPQIFIKGEFVGGSDIVLTMHQKGELKDLLADIIRGSSQDSA